MNKTAKEFQACSGTHKEERRDAATNVRAATEAANTGSVFSLFGDGPFEGYMSEAKQTVSLGTES